MRPPVTITLPLEVIEEIARAAAALVSAELEREAASAQPEWLSVESAARYLDVAPERVRKLLAQRALPYYQEAPGCRVFFRRAELDAWMSRTRIAPKREPEGA